MKKIWLVILAGLLFYSLAHAETVVLKSGTTVKGKILERTDKYVKIDFYGTPTTFFISEISDILPDTPKPSFKTMKITYKIAQKLFGSKGEPVHETLGEKVEYIDAVNNKSRTEENTTTTMGDFQTKDQKLNIFDGKRSYSIDLKKREGFYIDMEMPEEDGFTGSGVLLPSPSEADVKFLVGSEEILGKKCDIYSYTKDSKIWLWNGIILKQENNGDRTYNLNEAVNIEKDIPISPDLFKIPPGIVVKSVGASMGDSIEKFNSITSTEKEIKKLEDAGIADLGAAMFNPAEEEKLINAIKNDATLSDDKKQEMIKNFKKTISQTRKRVDGAMTADGKIDLDMAITKLGAARNEALIKACKANLQMIQGAKEMWALDQNKPDSAVPTPEDLKMYLPRMPKCPSGGGRIILEESMSLQHAV